MYVNMYVCMYVCSEIVQARHRLNLIISRSHSLTISLAIAGAINIVFVSQTHVLQEGDARQQQTHVGGIRHV